METGNIYKIELNNQQLQKIISGASNMYQFSIIYKKKNND